jgi:phage terminase small subunit
LKHTALFTTGHAPLENPTMKLTDKQERFAQAIADGMNQSDAYRAAYDVKEATPKSVNELASKVLSNVKVASRVDQLKAKLEAKALWTRQDSVEALRNIAIDSEARANEIVAAIKELNAMHGYQAPTKSEIAVTFPKVINVIAGRA